MLQDQSSSSLKIETVNSAINLVIRLKMYFLTSLLALAVLSSRDVSALPISFRLIMKRHDCEDCPSQIQENETVSFSCTLTPCTPGMFSVGFYRVDYDPPVIIHTDSDVFPNGSSVNVTDLEGHDCGKLLTFVASASLDRTVLQCVATNYHQDVLGSIARVIRMEEHHPVDPKPTSTPDPTNVPTETPTFSTPDPTNVLTETPSSGCDCPTKCREPSSVSSSTQKDAMDLTFMILTLVSLLMNL